MPMPGQLLYRLTAMQQEMHHAIIACCAVIDGMDIVKKIEGVGSGDGKPSKAVHIADSGEITGAGSATA